MKKLLAMLGATGLVVSTGAILVSCNEKEAPKDETVEKLAFTLSAEGTAETQTVVVGKNEGFDVLVTVKAPEAPDARVEDKVAKAEFSEETGEVTVTALTEGTVTFEVTTTPKPEPAPETKAEGEEAPAPEPVLIKTIIVNVTKEVVETPETPNLKALKESIATAKAIKDEDNKKPIAYKALQTAITKAEGIKAEAEAEAAKIELDKAVSDYEKAPAETPHLDALNESIKAAKEIKDTDNKKPIAYKALQTAITKAEGIKAEAEAEAAKIELDKAVSDYEKAPAEETSEGGDTL